MANLYVTHHRYPSNPQLFTITLNKVASLGGEPNPNFSPSFPSAEEYWKLFIYTTGLDENGGVVGPLVADLTGSEETIQSFIDSKLSEMCELIDWSNQGTLEPQIDTVGPYIDEQYPNNGEVNVPINRPISIRVKEPLPGTGINPSSVVLIVNGIQVTPKAVGNKYDMTFTFSPRPIYNS